ncbi:MAG: hypothetical protein KF727_10205 [Microbacteriaceae bacterium]|nr:hypothetical protein [Microbacteriaceae bacterium]
MSRTVLPVWLITLVLAILVGVFAGPGYLGALPLVLAFAVLATFVIQLALSRKEELATRMIYSIGGSLVILAGATGVLWLLDGRLPA